jgi:hypothetical protein
VFIGVFSVFLLFRVLLGTRRKRKAGHPVDIRAVTAVCLLSLGSCVVALSQVLSHQ